MKSGAHISPDGKYRYCLCRVWDDQKDRVLFIGLNPSTADAAKDDPTVRRYLGYAQSWGYGGLYVGNLFAFRATEPAAMLKAADPVGPDNDRWLRALARRATMIVACWGDDGRHLSRSATIRAWLPRLHAVKLNQSGEPAHVLYLPADLPPFPLPPVLDPNLDDFCS
jgi:hypothetical protein